MISRAAPWFSLLVGLTGLGGCSALETCPEAQPDRTIEGGSTDLAALTYVSADWDGPLSEFPAKTRLTFLHGLSVEPDVVLTWVSFAANGTAGGDVTENAGNQGRIECVDARVIQLRNDTCEEALFVRVVASARGTGSTDETCE